MLLSTHHEPPVPSPAISIAYYGIRKLQPCVEHHDQQQEYCTNSKNTAALRGMQHHDQQYCLAWHATPRKHQTIQQQEYCSLACRSYTAVCSLRVILEVSMHYPCNTATVHVS